jgi:hypothetical protein
MNMGEGSRPRICSKLKEDSKEILDSTGSLIPQHAMNMPKFIGLNLKIAEVF